MAKITNYSLGSQGVILDPHHLLPGVSPEGMSKSQNFFHDSNAGFAGALRKRPGFQKFNPLNMGGAILGGIGMPVAGNGSAVGGGASIGTGDSDTGTSTGTGDGTGLPGATWDGAAGPTFVPPSVGAAFFTGAGTTLFGGARLVVIGRGNNSGTSGSNGGIGWFVSSKGLADTAIAVTLTTGLQPACITAYPPTTKFAGINGTPSVYHAASGYFYYAAGHDQASGTVTTIRKTNGATDSLVATIPLSPDAAGFSNGNVVTGQNRQHITDMHLGYDGFIYLSVKDRAGGQDVLDLNYGRVYKMTTTGTLTEAPALTKAVLPYCCAFFNGKLFWGVFNLSNSEVAVPPANLSTPIYSTDDAFATTSLDTLLNSFLPTGNIDAVTTSMITFPSTGEDQVLWAGIGVNGNGTDYPNIFNRLRGPSATVAWGMTLTGSGGASATHGCCFPSMAEFNGNLYASFYNPGQIAKIYKFVPDYSAIAPSDGHWLGSGTWSTVHTAAATVSYTLFVDDGVMYAIGQLGFGGAQAALVTTDGTTWMDKSASLPAFGNQSYPLPILAGFSQ